MSIYDKLGARTAGIKARVVERPGDKPPRTGPGIHLDATARMHAAEAHAEELEAQLKLAGAGQPLRIRLEDLHEVDGRKRHLAPAEYNELRDNLRINELVTPIAVRARAEGGYEVISGHNRLQAYRDLKKTDIPAVVRETGDAQADLNAFYANLLHPSLPDYQKYLGFKMIQRRMPGLASEEIATMTGKSRRHIEQLLKFDALPEAALAILASGPVDLGGNAAEALAKLAENGRAERVTAAIGKLAAGEFNQKQAIAFASALDEKKPAPRKSPVGTIRQGHAVYCTVTQASKVIRLEFASKDEAVAAEQVVREALNKLAQAGKKRNG